MSSNFDEAMKYTMEFEGWDSITDDPKDKGGLTKYGISKRAYPNIDIASLTYEDAKVIYYRDYWKKAGCADYTDPEVSIKVFDMAVNAGVVQALRLVQQAVNDCSGANIVVDGRIGPNTISAVNKVDGNVLMIFLVTELENFYTSLNNPKYIKGWLRRARVTPKCV